MKKLIVLFPIIVIMMTSCTAMKGRSLGRVPYEPESIIAVTINSLPNGAYVFAINQDGTLGEKLGTTPYRHEVGIAAQHMHHRRAARPMYCHEIYAWGKGTYWLRGPKDNNRNNPTLKLRVALWKEGSVFGIGEKILLKKYRSRRGKYGWYHASEDLKSQDISWTIPLKTIEQLQAELTVRALQQTRNQNIVIQQQKDDIDTANGLFDLFYKMKALKYIK